MQKQGVPQFIVLLLAVVFTIGLTQSVQATDSSLSDNYEATQLKFGTGSTDDSCSGQYCARVSIGNVGSGGESVSQGETKASFGSITPDEPVLEMIVQPGQSNLGTLTAETTGTQTSIIQIRNYLSDGYTLQVIGNPPSYQGHTLAAPSTPTANTTGTEQFAINAVANSQPAIGSDPVQRPSNGFSFGQVEADYNTADVFKYSSGDTIARSNSESGQTDYTISLIVNISEATPAGHYSTDLSAVVIPIF